MQVTKIHGPLWFIHKVEKKISMEHLRRDWSDFLEYAKEFITEPFVVLDVGCSGGIDEILNNFGDKLIYYGVDPNIKEVERLNENNTNPNISYINCFMNCGDIDRKNDKINRITDFFEITSAAEGAKIIKERQENEHRDLVENNLWTEMELTSKYINMDEFIIDNGIEYIDFIKTDIDGLDLNFFKNIEKYIEKIKLNAIMAEVSFASDFNDEADLTNLLKKYYFALNLLSIRQYSTKFLPNLYALNLSAQTISGRILQGDALYIKDKSQFGGLSPQELLKISMVMDLVSLTDCAAEIFNLFEKELASTGINIRQSLDLMSKQRRFMPSQNYDDFLNSFYTDHESFYPQKYSAKALMRFLDESIVKLGMNDFYRLMLSVNSPTLKDLLYSFLKKIRR